MKKIKLFTFAYFLFFMLFTGALFAQTSYNLTGTFEGVRKQYDAHHESFMQEFQYQFNLVQEGDAVTGTSTIFSENGDYADVKIRGYVVGNKFYFEEYEIIDQIKAEYRVWCYKSGQLDISRKEGKIYLSGETKSFMSNYGAPCTGGFTEIAKFEDKQEPCFGDCIEDENKMADVAINVQLYPNPTSNEATISFDVVKRNKVSVEVYDLSGRLVAIPLNKVVGSGYQSTTVSLENESTGLFIVKLTIGNEVYSKELVKAAR